MSELGTKFDEGKPRMSLLSTLWINGVVRVLNLGAKKYTKGDVPGDDNWRKGLKHRRLLDSALRHIFAYSDGEDFDPETQECHLYHASCCLMFLSELRVTRPDLDDRYGRVNLPDETEHEPPNPSSLSELNGRIADDVYSADHSTRHVPACLCVTCQARESHRKVVFPHGSFKP